MAHISRQVLRRALPAARDPTPTQRVWFAVLDFGLNVNDYSFRVHIHALSEEMEMRMWSNVR